MEEDSFYVGIREPIEARRNLLETSKLIIQNLQRYERIKGIREQKLIKIAEMKKILREIKSLNSKLKDSVPQTNLRASSEKLGKTKKSQKNRKKGELDKLEKELNEVEKELGKLR